MTLPGTYTINGKTFDKKHLQEHAQRMAEETGVPAWEKELFGFINDFLSEDQPLYQRTSGTTGDPRVFPLLRSAMLRSAQNTLQYFNLRPGNHALLCLPVEYIAGKMMVVRALAGQLNLVTTRPAGNPLADQPSDVDFAAMVPLQLEQSIGQLEDNSKIRTLILGGGETGPALRTKIRETKGCAIYETFGMSETYTHFAVRRLNGPDPEPFFRLLPGVKVWTDERGCLVTEVPGVTEAPVVTNDMVSLEGDNRFRWLGRIDNVIKTGGIKINPEVLEAQIREITGLEVLVSPLPDERLGERLVLVVEGREKDLPAGLGQQLSNTLQKHEIPRIILTLKEFPRNRSMKTDRLQVLRFVRKHFQGLG